MARKTTKKTEEVTLTPPIPPVNGTQLPSIPPEEEGGIPLPEGATPETAIPPAGVTVELAPPPVPPGLHVEEPEEVCDVTPAAPAASTRQAISPEHATVRMRALGDLDFCPTFGRFTFDEVVGREPRSGQQVRGKIRNGFVYNVPRYVCDAMVERDWGMRVN